MNHLQPICSPDLSSSSFRFTVERVMDASPDVLYRAWTEQFDRWFATLGTLLMKAEVNAIFSWEIHHDERQFCDHIHHKKDEASPKPCFC
jgi:uncharacterized protein YndB with AHSA1/START domain